MSCQGINKNGQNCSRLVETPDIFCWQHKDPTTEIFEEVPYVVQKNIQKYAKINLEEEILKNQLFYLNLPTKKSYEFMASISQGKTELRSGGQRPLNARSNAGTTAAGRRASASERTSEKWEDWYNENKEFIYTIRDEYNKMSIKTLISLLSNYVFWFQKLKTKEIVMYVTQNNINIPLSPTVVKKKIWIGCKSFIKKFPFETIHLSLTNPTFIDYGTLLINNNFYEQFMKQYSLSDFKTCKP